VKVTLRKRIKTNEPKTSPIKNLPITIGSRLIEGSKKVITILTLIEFKRPDRIITSNNNLEFSKFIGEMIAPFILVWEYLTNSLAATTEASEKKLARLQTPIYCSGLINNGPVNSAAIKAGSDFKPKKQMPNTRIP
jgi:hypothetical protein